MARTILVVDDEPTLRETIVEALEADGFRVVRLRTDARRSRSSAPSDRTSSSST
jgi:DNA-binding response OmpR family regulator